MKNTDPGLWGFLVGLFLWVWVGCFCVWLGFVYFVCLFVSVWGFVFVVVVYFCCCFLLLFGRFFVCLVGCLFFGGVGGVCFLMSFMPSRESYRGFGINNTW